MRRVLARGGLTAFLAALLLAGLVPPGGAEPPGRFVFRPYGAIAPDERRLLDAARLAWGDEVLSGERLYAALATRTPERLANYLNQTAVLATVRLDDGATALSKLSAVKTLYRAHVHAYVAPTLAVAIAARATGDPATGKPYLGPEYSGVLHGKYDLSYRENRAYTSQQLCFSTIDNYTEVDLDLDEECPLAGSATALAMHVARAVTHQLWTWWPGDQEGEDSDPGELYQGLRQRGLAPHYGLAP